MSVPFPYTFIIGVQKAGTTTPDNWLIRHSQVYGYETLKDVHLFNLVYLVCGDRSQDEAGTGSL